MSLHLLLKRVPTTTNSVFLCSLNYRSMKTEFFFNINFRDYNIITSFPLPSLPPNSPIYHSLLSFRFMVLCFHWLLHTYCICTCIPKRLSAACSQTVGSQVLLYSAGYSFYCHSNAYHPRLPSGFPTGWLLYPFAIPF